MYSRKESTDEQNQKPRGGQEEQNEERITGASLDRGDRLSNSDDAESPSESTGSPSSQRSSPSTGKNVAFIEKKPKRKRRPPKVPWKKPADMPKRPLSAYNLYFAHERERLVKRSMAIEGASQQGITELTAEVLEGDDKELPSFDVSKFEMNEQERKSKARRHMKTSGIGFANMAKIIGSKWKSLNPDSKSVFEKKAAVDKARYDKEMVVWRRKKIAASTPPDEDSRMKRRSSEPLLRENRGLSNPSKHRPLTATYQPGDDFDTSAAEIQHHSDSSVSPLMESLFGEGGYLESDEDPDYWSSPSPTLAEQVEMQLSPIRRYHSSPSVMELSPIAPPNLGFDPNFEAPRIRPLLQRQGEEIKEAPITSIVQESFEILQSSLDEEQMNFLTNLPFEE